MSVRSYTQLAIEYCQFHLFSHPCVSSSLSGLISTHAVRVAEGPIGVLAVLTRPGRSNMGLI